MWVDLGTEATQTLKHDAASSCQLVKEGTLYTTRKGSQPSTVQMNAAFSMYFMTVFRHCAILHGVVLA